MESETEFMTVGDYAGHLAVSAPTVYRLVRSGLPHARLGRLIRIPVAQADRWLVDNREGTSW